MADAKACMSLQELQNLIDSGIWKNNPDLLNEIFLRYTEIAVGQESTNFGNSDFWDSVLHHSDFDENEPWELERSCPITSEELDHSDFIENDQQPGSSKPITLEELDEYIRNNSDHWKDVPLLQNQLYQRFLELSHGHQNTDFGTPEFWQCIMGDEIIKENNTPEFHEFIPGNEIEKEEMDLSNQNQFGQFGHGNDSCHFDNFRRYADSNTVEIVPSNHYELRPKFLKSSKRWGTDYGQYDLHFKNMSNVDDIELMLLGILTDVLETVKADGQDKDQLSFYLDHPVLEIPIIIPLQRQKDMTAEMIVQEIMNVLQSKASMTFDDKMTVYFTRINRPAGSGRTERKFFTNIDQYLKRKKGLIEIINTDDLCCARAIVTAKALIDNDRYNSVRNGDRNGATLQRLRAKALMQQANLQDHKGSCGPEEWKKLQKALGVGQYQLKIFNKATFNSLAFQGPPAPKILHLWLCDTHFHAITSMPAFFESAYFCEACNKAYKDALCHRICPAHCHVCLASGKCITQYPLKKCNECNRFFNNQTCFENHLKAPELKTKQKIFSLCKKLKRCETCRIEYFSRKGHQCGVRECPICKVEITSGDNNHECYIQPYTGNEKENEDMLVQEDELDDTGTDERADNGDREPARKKQKIDERTTFIFYDFECRQDDAISHNENGEINLHCPNLVIAHKVSNYLNLFFGNLSVFFYLQVCDQCCDLVSDSNDMASLPFCNFCKDNRQCFDGDSCLDKFCEWLFSKQNKNAIAIAHNTKGYDGQFILQYCHRKGLKPKQIISRGLGVMYLEVGAIKFKDSLNFIPFPLSAMPKTFGIPECKKGNLNYLFSFLSFFKILVKNF